MKAMLSRAIRSSGLCRGAKSVRFTFFTVASSSCLLPIISFCGVSIRYFMLSLVPASGFSFICNDRTFALSCAYRDVILSNVFRILRQTQASCSTCHNTRESTLLSACLQSTQQLYSLPAFPLCRDCCCLSIPEL